MKRSRLGAWLLVALVLAGSAAALFQRELSEALFARAVAARADGPLTRLEDGLHLFLCGSGSPLPDPGRAGPCIGVVAGDRVLVIDAGSGSARNLARAGFPLGRIDQVLLTHLHSDHIDGLGELMVQAWVGGSRQQPLIVSGPAGVDQVVQGFNTAYRVDAGFRIAHHGEQVAPPGGFGGISRTVELPGGERTAVLLESADLRVTVVAVSHQPVEPAFGYRIDYKGRSAIISGDTRYDEGLAAAASGVDVLLHEALQPTLVGTIGSQAAAAGRRTVSRIMADIPGYHTSPEDAARLAQRAGARQLVLYHIIPPLPSRLLHPAFLGDARQQFDGELVVGFDGLLISLPADSRDIRRMEAL